MIVELLPSITVSLVISLTHGFQQVTAGGSLDFLTLFSYQTLPSGDDTYSIAISTNGSFPFGASSIHNVYVSTDGYISMGKVPVTSNPSIPGSYSIVAPYGADIDTSIAGTVRYTQFTSSDPQMTTVNDFIEEGTGNRSEGTRIMVAEWDGVAQYGGNSSVTSSFQCVLITDGSASYAVFIYECGGMGWGGATIGWQENGVQYAEHFLSGNKSADVGCRSSFNYTTVIYRLYYNIIIEDCRANQFTCDNGHCIDKDGECNTLEECSDGSDEDQCTNIGLAIGLGLGLPGGVIIITIFYSTISYHVICKKKCRKIYHQPARRTIIIRTNPRSTERQPVTVRTVNQESSLNAPVPSTIPKSHEVKFSDGNVPPSYNAATAFPPPPNMDQIFKTPVTASPHMDKTVYPSP